MSAFLDWLEVEARGFEVVSLIFKILIIDLIWTFFAMMVMVSFGSTFSFFQLASIPIPDSMDWSFLVFLFSAAMIEEVIFRHVPLLIAVLMYGKSPRIIGVMVVSSIIFGLIHGGPLNLVFQGVGGFFLSIIFLKCGGFQMRPLKALFASTTAHFLYNLIIFFIGMMARGMLS